MGRCAVLTLRLFKQLTASCFRFRNQRPSSTKTRMGARLVQKASTSPPRRPFPPIVLSVSNAAAGFGNNQFTSSDDSFKPWRNSHWIKYYLNYQMTVLTKDNIQTLHRWKRPVRAHALLKAKLCRSFLLRVNVANHDSDFRDVMPLNPPADNVPGDANRHINWRTI